MLYIIQDEEEKQSIDSRRTLTLYPLSLPFDRTTTARAPEGASPLSF